ncbi:hypothetical protein GV794_01135 [Nocardia cyriacigeorgica]|uniref:Uncharacterized protein n=1 Tax=Nocardia cyriacigeorgica TaxID=135487 RepID=A0A6P1D6V9_9NOCA|nr:hypothetical protein [Nocardia cyriacigeorgica]NEW45104.1 hypothetical protein [Nocardia cyriacigeorgica]NEW51139.1 hypothetical protein [Nocardia cyriacigeorgica]NEW54276.1 hypothetical protein [Nocardia cyriacigeorgica]
MSDPRNNDAAGSDTSAEAPAWIKVQRRTREINDDLRHRARTGTPPAVTESHRMRQLQGRSVPAAAVHLD